MPHHRTHYMVLLLQLLQPLWKYISLSAVCSQEAGLPNINGEANAQNNGYGFIHIYDNNSVTGCFKAGTSQNSTWAGTNRVGYSLGFDASLASPIYGNSDTVTPLSTATQFFIKF